MDVELLIALLVVGAAIIIGVVIYNRVQEARFRERAETAFAPPASDALFEHGATRASDERIEPQFQDDAPDASWPAQRQEPHAGPEPAPGVLTSSEPDTGARPDAQAPAVLPRAAAAPAGEAGETARAAVPRRGAEPDTELSYVADLSAREPVPVTALEQLVRALGPLAARVRLWGRQDDDAAWRQIDLAAPEALRLVRATLQLADRRGAVTQQDVVIFQSAVARCAAAVAASASIPDAAPALARSRELDEFCAEMDLVVGLNLVAPHERPFTGTRLRGLAEAAGFRFERGTFVFPDGQGGARFTLEAQGSGPLTAEALRTLQAPGVTLLLDVPRQSDGVAAFDQMVGVGRQLAHSLGASLVDDNHVPVSDAGLEQIRNQLRTIYASMEAHGIPAGSPLALRLFA